jgi:Fe-S-cluster-containing dehydrogenase component/CRP-like cAMP-binding protein
MPDAAVQIEKPNRWDVPFGPDMTSDNVNSVLGMRPFRLMDPESFPLDEIILNDTRIRICQEGELVLRQGDYCNSAFFVLNGSVRVVLQPGLDPEVLGRSQPKRKTMITSLTQLLTNSKEPEARNVKQYEHDARIASQMQDGGTRVFLQDIQGIVDKHRTALLRTGEFFGEASALSRIPVPATVVAAEANTYLLEIRWQGLRELMKYDPALRAHIDELYRERMLKDHLKSVPLFEHLDDADLERVAEETEFISYGDYDWSGTYKRLVKQGQRDQSAQEPVIIEEGDYPDGMILVRSGFVRVSRKHGNGLQTLRYLGSGTQYGLEEMVTNWVNKKQAPISYRHTLRAIGYTHVIIVPTRVMESIVLPKVSREQLQPHLLTPEISAEPEEAAAQGDFLEFLAEHRFINGTASMVINLDRCVRCDDCVRACADTHEGNPRFLRHGPVIDNVMVAHACMHCQDPVCMLGCPTGAIHRSAVGGQVVVNDQTCIGCGACATNCPYHAIRLVEVRDKKGIPLISQEGAPIVKATKCDLCADQLGGPSCERACPHSALRRVDMRNLDEIKRWLKK